MNIRNWNEFKEWQMKGLKEHISLGRVDKPILGFLLKVNNAENIVTTSSCSGRVVVIGVGKTKKDSIRLYNEHEFVEGERVFKAVKEVMMFKDKEPYLKVEPFIYHFVARDLKSAEKLVDVVFKAGVKRVGMRPIRFGRYLIEFMGTVFDSIPLRYVELDENIVDYLNKRLQENEKRRKVVEDALIETFVL